MIKSIPLSKLVASNRKVRRSSDPDADLRLKADIEAPGLLQNLVVSPVRKPRGCFAVEAGGRRLRALQSLHRFPPPERLREAAMHLGGIEREVLALRTREGLGIREIARRLRIDPRAVERILRRAVRKVLAEVDRLERRERRAKMRHRG